ncbi:hypothetical protein MUK42_06235 [Musa troglodytarum]|uniref:Uncharacterized protein n=1 Tax=Musa troglodytarum TaxID=320322 RepID=A0A9E7H979_9LILI|nr:hypothetical protein MUK42_06235 [Musa troglodytarum]
MGVSEKARDSVARSGVSGTVGFGRKRQEGIREFYSWAIEMENCPMRVNTTGQLYTDCMSDRKSRFWQIDNEPNHRSEAICPQPRRAAKVPYLIHTCSGVISKPKGILPMHRVDCAPEILDLILSQNDPYNELDSSNQVGFICCGSPPMRTSNPVVQDVRFAKQAQSSASSPCGNSPGMKQAGMVQTGSPTCGSSRGGSPKARIEGFACGSSEKQHVAPARA